MILTTVLFVFPPVLPVTGSNMNYCIVAFAVWLIISVAQWIVDGRKHYTGPTVEIDDNLGGKVLEAINSPEPTHYNAVFDEQGHRDFEDENMSRAKKRQVGAARGGRDEVGSTKELAEFLKDS